MNTNIVNLIENSRNQLTLSDGVAEFCKDLCKKNYPRNQEMFIILYNEWFGECLDSYNQMFREALNHVDNHFVDWFKKRLMNPFYIPTYTRKRIIRDYGEEFFLKMYLVYWRQECQWAQVMSMSNDDIISIMSNIWLELCRSNPSDMFIWMCELLFESYENNPYDNHPYNLYSLQEIISFDEKINEIDEDWMPLWLRWTRKEFTSILEKQNDDYIKKTSKMVRIQYMKEKERKFRLSLYEDLKLFNRIVFDKDIIISSVERGLNSNQLLILEQETLIHFLNKNTNNPIVHFSDLIKNEDFKVVISKTERELYKNNVKNRLPDWLENIPEWLHQIDYDNYLKQMEWEDAIQNGKRMPPKDILLDYILWLVEN